MARLVSAAARLMIAYVLLASVNRLQIQSASARASELDDLTYEASKGDAKAAEKLATMLYYGNGIQQDYHAAYLWYEVAAREDNLLAQMMLAGLYLSGIGTVKDDEKSYMWYNIASARLKPEANLTGVVSKLMTAQQIAAAQEMTRRCVNTHSKDCD